MLRDLRRLYLLFTGRVPMYKIAGVLILGVGGYAILSPILGHFERKSPLHTVIKPKAEDRVRASSVARKLIGDDITFGPEDSYEYSGSDGDFTCSIRGSKGKGDLAVSGSEVNGVWHLDSAVLVIKDQRVQIPVN
jgi:hypothetical protein